MLVLNVTNYPYTKLLQITFSQFCFMWCLEYNLTNKVQRLNLVRHIIFFHFLCLTLLSTLSLEIYLITIKAFIKNTIQVKCCHLKTTVN